MEWYNPIPKEISVFSDSRENHIHSNFSVLLPPQQIMDSGLITV